MLAFLNKSGSCVGRDGGLLLGDRLAWSSHRHASFPTVPKSRPRQRKVRLQLQPELPTGPAGKGLGLDQACLDLLDGYSPSPSANLKFHLLKSTFQVEKQRTWDSLNLYS